MSPIQPNTINFQLVNLSRAIRKQSVLQWSLGVNSSNEAGAEVWPILSLLNRCEIVDMLAIRVRMPRLNYVRFCRCFCVSIAAAIM